ncbi:FIST C-terminal domain-containing protein [Shinella sp. CPCC 101442]|uniref:FIST N-terminal domain-containing protein n=1 Tax=Shinella sp. CPCC 101442 TaxID=2932265 RepID=UPI002152493F|nr:FIST N-terminal domain-containing protein [Shinella sp. CPCC 101442]MCR6498305.1 FIST C-terminal domain-containing protein [Shinella sp. CPCC 101442]
MDEHYVARALVSAHENCPVDRLAASLGSGPFSLVLLFVSPEADVAGIVAEASKAWPDAKIAGCTTAGEITGDGYDEETIVAVGFNARHFAAETLLVPDLSKLAASELSDALLLIRQSLARDHGHLPEEFALLLVDGLSAREDELASALAAATGAMPLIGGSAGDGTHFRETLVFDGERLLANAAVISVIRGDCPLRSFKMDHIKPTERRMVVTEADPAARIVRRINAEPAIHEYARLIGMDPESVNTLTFAIHPLTVRMGERHHVRAIQRVLPSGELLFFSAIDEGMVLTIAEPHDLVGHLSAELQALKAPANPVAVLAFDCILRRIEAQERQMTGRVSDLLRQHGVIGFSTYGEQIGPMHINHTMTGFAFYPPGTVVSGKSP